MLLVVVVAIWGGIATFTGGGSHISDDEAIERVDTAYSDCLDAIGLSVAGATVVRVDDPNSKGRHPSRVILGDGAEFTVNALPTGAAPSNDQAFSDLDAAGC